MRSIKRGQAAHTFLIAAIVIVALVIIGTVIFFALNSPEKEEALKPSPVSEQCSFACESGQKSAFCDVERKVSDGVTATCIELSTNTQYSGFNVQPCATISCATQATDQSCSGLGGVWMAPDSGTCPVQEGNFSRQRTPTDSPPITGQICCYYYE